MKLTRTINLQGIVFNIDDDAYNVLKNYLSDIESRLAQDERKDVMEDIESRIAELLQSLLFARKVEAVTVEMIDEVRRRIGNPEEFGENKRPVFKRDRFTRQGVGRVITIVLKVILIIIALQLLFPVLAAVFALLMGFFGLTIGGISLIPALGVELMGSTAWTCLLLISVLVALLMPVYMIIHWIVTYSRTRKHPGLRFWLITLLIWFLSLGGLAASAVHILKVNGTNLKEMKYLIDNNYDDDDEYLTKETRVLDAFNAIEASGAVQLQVLANAPDQEVFVGYKNGVIRTVVRDSVLYINGEGNHLGKAVIRVPQLCSLSLSGASEAELEGTADSLRITLSGASKVDADELVVQHLHIKASGASKAEVNVVKTLWAQASGASKIEYKGNPQVLQSMSVGASTIKRD